MIILIPSNLLHPDQEFYNLDHYDIFGFFYGWHRYPGPRCDHREHVWLKLMVESKENRKFVNVCEIDPRYDPGEVVESLTKCVFDGIRDERSGLDIDYVLDQMVYPYLETNKFVGRCGRCGRGGNK